jgi:hypothetical protein
MVAKMRLTSPPISVNNTGVSALLTKVNLTGVGTGRFWGAFAFQE